MFSADDCRLDEFITLVGQEVPAADYPIADSTDTGAVVFDAARVRPHVASGAAEAEIVKALSAGPGIVVIRHAVDRDIVDRATTAFRRIIEDERVAHGARGDHFGKPGANDRVWNALEKLAVEDPDTFVAYYSSDMIALGARAWLGPAYQITSQVNVVNPGGQAQAPHRDYHLGFMTDEMAERYPRHVHRFSAALTLQGALAHGDMPVESGPTKYLPHSHKYEPGYLAWRRPEFAEYFEQHYMQVPLAAGDLVYFNPALFHAAGSNMTADVRRMANLLQVNSAFGRTMESVDRERMSLAIYPALQRAHRLGMPDALLDNVIAASAEGYAFPTNLDLDQPVDSLTPDSQADVVRRALSAGAGVDSLAADLTAHAARRRTH